MGKDPLLQTFDDFIGGLIDTGNLTLCPDKINPEQM
jgi:hypothetical protein